MLNKSIMAGLAIACLSAAAGAGESQSMILDGNEVTVYENFAIQDKTRLNNAEIKSVNSTNPEVIAYFGNELQAVKANANDGNNIALVVPKNQPSYAIRSEIRYVCKSNAVDCIPDGIEAERIGTSNIYKVKVGTFAEWQATIKILKNTEAIKKVYPEYNYGNKNVVN